MTWLFVKRRRSKLLYLLVGLLVVAGTQLATAQERQQAIHQHGWYMYFGNHRLTNKWGLHTEYQFRRHGLIGNWQPHT